ncbi:hypothetical protein U1Q18_003332 [Sarracenia purpurea var. burkii]
MKVQATRTLQIVGVSKVANVSQRMDPLRLKELSPIKMGNLEPPCPEVKPMEKQDSIKVQTFSSATKTRIGESPEIGANKDNYRDHEGMLSNAAD